MLSIREMSNDEHRQLIDASQLWEAYEHRRALLEKRFSGSMRWVERSGSEYLLRKRGKVETSLGPKSPETEQAYRQFVDGRAETRDAVHHLEVRLERLAKVNVAHGLGRVPKLTARILRRLGDAGLLGKHLFVVGTNALFAYEAKAGVRFESGLLATTDTDLLLDARRRLGLAIDEGVRREGVLGIIRRIDRSFEPRGARDYRAVNRDGFFVDLIRPETGEIMSAAARDRIGQSEDDLRGSPIRGLDWLLHVPKFEAVAIDDGGIPVRIHTIDPRAIALHKAWVASQESREALKKRRDWDQATAVATLAEHHLNLPFDSPELSALPAQLREQASRLLAAGAEDRPEEEGSRPDWW